MNTEEEQYDELYKAVTGKDTMKIRELMKKRMNLKKHYGDEGNIMNVAITKASPEQLTALLEVDHLELSNKATLSCDRYNLINEPCNDQHQTPLMKSALSGKTDCLKILLHYGADVNAAFKGYHMRAIDYALDGDHSSVAQIVFLLLKADSLFPINESGQKMLKKLMKDNEEIKSFFINRDCLHAKLKEKSFDVDIKNLLDKENSSYYLNSKGQSALMTAAWNQKFEAWAYLKNRYARDTGDDEKMNIKLALDSHRESFNRALAKYYFKVRGAQVMKMVSKSRILGEDGSSKITGDDIETYYKYLNGNEITSALLRILHDEIDFEVIFDISSSDVSRMIAIPEGKVRGLTEYSHNRVYIGTKLSDDYEQGDMLGTLAHELAHKALSVVFQNDGKPYRGNDEAQKKKYMDVFSLLEDRVWSKDVDEILLRVNPDIYPIGALEQELIVRVPHMIAKYGESDRETDGLAKLEDQFPELLNYYNDWVMPAFKEAISTSCTNYRMTVKDMCDFYKCLKSNTDEKISVSSRVVDFREKLHRHNGLGILKVSNIRLGLSHLKTQLENEIRSVEGGIWHEPLLLSWQQFKYQWLNVMKALSNRAVGTLVISWNAEKPPLFCKRNKNCHHNCIFQEIVKDWVEEQKSIVDYDQISENIIIVLDTDLPSIKEIEPINYLWNDLSDKTKEFILSREVQFQGKKMTVSNIVNAAKTNGSIEDYMSTSLSAFEISYLIEESKICIGEKPGWSSEEKMYKNVFYHKDYYIQRSFGHRMLSRKALEKATTIPDIFFVRNASIKELIQIGLKEEFISLWNPSNINSRSRFFLCNQNRNKIDTEEILDWCKNHYHPIHFLTFDSPYLVYDWSCGSVTNIMEDIEDDTHAHDRRNNYFHTNEYQEMDDESSITQNNHLTEKKFILHEMAVKCDESPSKSAAYKIKPTLIADISGGGKSFVMNNIATELKKMLPYTWIISTNFNFYANSHSAQWLDGLKNLKGEQNIIRFLFGMAYTKRPTSLDMTLFKTFARRRGGVIALFDGFDEICPNYKYEVISFLKELSKLETVKFCVTTRLSEKYDLQKALNCVSFRLKPFKITKQKEFLNRYWNASLKNYAHDKKQEKIQGICYGLTQFSKINSTVDIELTINKLNTLAEALGNDCNAELSHEEINFEKFADTLIKNISRQNKDKERFTETPLHIFMVANVVFEDSFAVAERWNLSQLYEQFLRIKMKIFDKEKAMSTDSVAAGRSAEMAKKSAYKILEKLSVNVFIQPAPCVCSREETEDAVRVGLVKDVMGTDQFIHRSFAEFLFAKWAIRKAKKKNVTLFWLQKLFFDSSFSGVWWFLDHLLELRPEEKLQFKVSALSEEELWGHVSACLYVIIAVTFPSILQIFVNEFGVEVVKLLMKDNVFPRENAYTEIGVSSYDWFTYSLKTMTDSTLKFEGDFNAFQLIAYLRSCSGIEAFATDKAEEMTKKLLELVVQNDLTKELNKKFCRKSWDIFIPEGLYGQFDSFKSCLSEVIIFLIQHQELFRGTLKQVFLHNTEIWIFLDAKTFIIMDTLATSVLEQEEYTELILKKNKYLSLSWSRILCSSNLEEIEEIWKRISSKIQHEERKNFLIGRESDNQLKSALSNHNDNVWSYWWNLATFYISTEECKKIIHSAVQSEFSHFTSDAIHHCYQFLERLGTTSYLNEKELVDLLIYEEENPHHKFSSKDYTWDLHVTPRLFHLHQLVSVKVLAVTEYVISKIASHPCLWFIIHSMVSGMDSIHMEFSEQMMTLVDRYDEIVNSVTESPLIDMRERDLERETKGEKFCMALFFSILEMGRNYMESIEFIKLLQLPDFAIESDHYSSSTTELAPLMPNVLQIALTLDSPFLYGLLCAILKTFITNEQMKALLFAVNINGDTAYHIASRSHRKLLPKLEILAIDTMGKNGLEELLLVRNKHGYLAEDLLHNADHSGGFTTSYDV